MHLQFEKCKNAIKVKEKYTFNENVFTIKMYYTFYMIAVMKKNKMTINVKTVFMLSMLSNLIYKY